MCSGILDNWFGIDPPDAPPPAPPRAPTYIANNPSASAAQSDLTVDGDETARRARRRGRNSLRIDRNGGSGAASGSTGLNIPQ